MKPMGRYAQFVLSNSLLNLKQILEYKANLFFSLAISLIYMLVHLLFVLLFKDQFTVLFDWDLSKILFFIFISQFAFQFAAAFYFHSNLQQEILSGKLNLYLTRPLNTFVQYFFMSGSLRPLFAALMHFFLLCGLIVVYHIPLTYFFPAFMFLITSILFTIIFMRCIEAFSFVFKADRSIIKQIVADVTITVHTFPATIFEGTLKKLLLFLPQVYYSAYVTTIFFGDLSNYAMLLETQVILMSILALVTVILWKVGLKRYEAYG